MGLYKDLHVRALHGCITLLTGSWGYAESVASRCTFGHGPCQALSMHIIQRRFVLSFSNISVRRHGTSHWIDNDHGTTASVCSKSYIQKRLWPIMGSFHTTHTFQRPAAKCLVGNMTQKSPVLSCLSYPDILISLFLSSMNHCGKLWLFGTFVLFLQHQAARI